MNADPTPSASKPAASGKASKGWILWTLIPIVLASAILPFVFKGSQKPVKSHKPMSIASLRAVYTNKRVGERFKFGRYPQGADGEVKPITWRVLKRENGTMLVISELCLDAKPYNDENKEITWSDCTLRLWLNGEFFQKAFDAPEQSLIKTSRLANKVGPATEDRVFLLSADESYNLFAGNADSEAKPTAYSIKNGAYIHHGNAWYWLRTRYRINNYALYITIDGAFHATYAYNASGAVRPALRIAL